MASAIVLGMPQLCAGSLSETWLLKDIGHRHWVLLARAMGRSLPEFEDETGAAIHPAFTAVSIRQRDLTAARANAVLEVAGELSRLSNTQFRTLHRLSIGGMPVAEVEVISVFARRMVAGVNRSAATATPLGLPRLMGRPPLTGFAATASALRAERWQEHFGFRRGDGRPQAELVIDPCPVPGFQWRRLSLLRHVPGLRRSRRMGVLPLGRTPAVDATPRHHLPRQYRARRSRRRQPYGRAAGRADNHSLVQVDALWAAARRWPISLRREPSPRAEPFVTGRAFRWTSTLIRKVSGPRCSPRSI